MIKEELKKEAEKNISNLKNSAIKISGKSFQITEGDYIQGYLDGAEPREKRIEELETRCTELFLQNNEFAERFEKSIEIIKELVRVEYADFTNGDYSNELSKVLKQAGQFIKENERK